MTKKEEQVLPVFERKIFRRIYVPKYENGEWKSRTNREIEEMNKGENIVKGIKGQRLSWLGHLERMEEYAQKELHSRTGRDETWGNCSFILILLLESCLQTCLTYTIAECTVNNS
jgi:hypothetical protein